MRPHLSLVQNSLNDTAIATMKVSPPKTLQAAMRHHIELFLMLSPTARKALCPKTMQAVRMAVLSLILGAAVYVSTTAGPTHLDPVCQKLRDAGLPNGCTHDILGILKPPIQ